jgi:hypothetical protein
MTTVSGSDFDAWIRAVSPDSFENGAFIDDHWTSWLRSTFESEGAIGREELDRMARAAIEGVIEARPWQRIVRDFEATTGRNLQIDAKFDGLESWLEVVVTIDGRLVGSFNSSPSPNVEVFIADLANQLREFALDEEVWGGWPTCPVHGTHPLEAGVGAGGTASWRCPISGAAYAIGGLESGAAGSNRS